METYHKKNIQRLVIGIVIVVFFVGGIFLGRYSQANSAENKLPEDAISLAQGKDFTQFWNVWKLLNDKYPFKEKFPTDEARLQGAISGMVASFKDPYTMFFPPKEAQLFADEVKGEFGGVGMEVGVKDGIITVIAPLKGSPAEKAGIKAGDYISKINGKTTEGMPIDEAISTIRGKVGTEVSVEIVRKDTPGFLNFKIIREVINIPVIDSKREGDVFIISFYSFSENSAKLFDDELVKFINSGSHKLIIDLRNNPGGFLDAAIDIGSDFIPQGKTIVRENMGNGIPETIYRSAGTELVLPKNLKLKVLVNAGSASASEILAGALSEHGVADLIGSQTFGKGSVQELIPLPDGSSVKITIAKWLTPNGVSISEKGITPKYIVTEKATEKNKDPVLKKALQLLK
jgi:carboxyl-terminal processing protease